jgi:CheY-like chemotaxis protein
MANSLQDRLAELELRIRAVSSELAVKKEEAEQSNRAKSNFIASISHDFRQPMHAIGLFAATLKHRVTTPEQHELAQRIEESVAALQSLFDGLLNISRMDSGMLEPNLEPCDLAALLKRVGQEFQPLAEQKGLNLRIHVRPAWVNSDSILLGRLLNNLVANAIRYTERGGVLLACRRRQGQWVVQIWDTGVGIAAEHLPKIFEAYYQVGNAERNSAQGVGLGLAIVSGIAHLLNYKIEVYSRLGRGSVFNLILPLAESPPIKRRSGTDRQLGQLNHERVLIIEDDQAAREALQGLLSSWGLDVLTAADYDQASRRIEQDQKAPALLICDYRLPQKSGVDTIAALRERLGVDVPAILISGDTMPESMAIMQASGLPILYKPVRPAKLRALITSLLARGSKAP